MTIIRSNGTRVELNDAAAINRELEEGGNALRANGSLYGKFRYSPENFYLDGHPVSSLIRPATTPAPTLPPVVTPPPTNTETNTMPPIFRMVLPTGEGFATGANLQGCSREHPEACDPQYFVTMPEVEAYAAARGEEVVMVDSQDEAWDVVETGEAPSRFFSNPLVWGLGGFVLLRFLRRKRE